MKIFLKNEINLRPLATVDETVLRGRTNIPKIPLAIEI